MIDKKKFEYLKGYIKKCADENIFPGASFGIVTKNKQLFDAVGYSEILPKKQATSINFIYDLASLSKVVSTTTVILKLIEQGQITLFTNVRDILNNFKYKNITVFDLLTHTSGLPSNINNYKMTCKSKKDLIDKVFETDLEYETGKKVLYSDIGFMLLGFIIEKIAGPIDKYFDENIAKPLNMINTFYNPRESVWLNCASTEYKNERGYVKGSVHDGKAYILGGVSGHAGLFSTVTDLGKFCTMILNSGVFNDKRILSKSSINMLKECHTKGLNERRTLGWQLKDKNNSSSDLASCTSIYHTGFTGTSILIDFENEFAFILLTNRIHPSRKNDTLVKLRRNINNIAETVIF